MSYKVGTFDILAGRIYKYPRARIVQARWLDFPARGFQFDAEYAFGVEETLKSSMLLNPTQISMLTIESNIKVDY